MSSIKGWLGSNVGNSSVSYGTVMLLVLVVIVTMIAYNLVLTTVRKVV